MIGKAIVVGSPLDTGYEAQWRFTHPDVFRVLFGADHGALTWTPILVLALAGLVIVSRRDRRLGLGLAIVLVTMVYLVASYGTYEQSSFGNRFLVWFTPGAVVGLSAMADSVWSAHRRLAVAVLAGLIVWNVLFMFQWSWGLVPKRGPVDWGVMAKQQFTDAPSGLLQAGRLFFTDRAELIRIVQERDIVNLEEGHG
jgi:hypothetical protein